VGHFALTLTNQTNIRLWAAEATCAIMGVRFPMQAKHQHEKRKTSLVHGTQENLMMSDRKLTSALLSRVQPNGIRNPILCALCQDRSQGLQQNTRNTRSTRVLLVSTKMRNHNGWSHSPGSAHPRRPIAWHRDRHLCLPYSFQSKRVYLNLSSDYMSASTIMHVMRNKRVFRGLGDATTTRKISGTT
jgi:hypothetical protein